jgi:integrase/recombinase XerD
MKPTVNVFLDTRKVQKNGAFPLKLSVTADRTNRSWSFGFSFTETEYAKIIKNQRREPYKDTWNEIEANIEKAEKVISDMLPFFTFEEFKERFFRRMSIKVVSDKTSLLHVLEEACTQYLKRGQYPMSVKLRESVKSILKYSKTDNLSMRMINPTFCRKYEEYMYSKSAKKSRNGAGINLRHIRILFNKAIEEDFIPKEWYPFKRGPGEKSEFKDAHVIPNERKIKDYLKEEEVVRLSEHTDFKNEAQKNAHTAWLISFYCNGCNPADFLQFKYGDIYGDFIVFYREKVKNATRSDMKPVKVYLSPELKQLIKKVGNPPKPDNYIFKCYTDDMSEEEKYKARRKFTSNATQSMKHLAESMGINKNIRLGNARHSLANILKKNGVDREIVKDLFGHTSILTVDNYFESFQDDQHAELAKSMISIAGIKRKMKKAKAKKPFKEPQAM